jgi:hypothetical protein
MPKCPYCHSSNVTTTRVKTKSGDKVKAALGVTAALGAAALAATAAPVLAPIVAIFGAKGVERICHAGAHRAMEAGKDEWHTSHVCKNCGHKWDD